METKVCCICGASKDETCKIILHNNEYYCNKHYLQLKQKGMIVNTYKYENEITYYDDYAEISLYDENNIEVAKSMVDLEDVDMLKEYRWSAKRCKDKDYYYAVTNTKFKDRWVRMHRLIMNAKDVDIIDHINHDTLDNRKYNLRTVTRSQNSMNVGIRSSNKSGATGVFWNKNYGKWWAYITVNKKTINLGYYKDFEDAVKVRKNAEEKYFGEHSYDNSMNRS